jgi:hypothetical protein
MPDALGARGLVCTCSSRKHTSNNEYPGITRRSRVILEHRQQHHVSGS